MEPRTVSARLAGRLAPRLGVALGALPAAPLCAAVEGAALLAWSLSPRRRASSKVNFGRLLAVPPSSPRARVLARQAYKNFGRMSLDFFRLVAVGDDELLARAEVSGQRFLDEALHRGKGVILALPHLGSWDLASRVARSLGYPLTAVVENDWNAAFAQQLRAMTGIRLVAREHSLRPIMRALAANEPVALVCDVVPPGAPSVRVCFAGQQACLPAGPARLAMRTGAAIVPCAIVALPSGQIEATATAAITPLRSDGDEELRRLTQTMAGHFETLIRRHPEQWYAFRPLDGCDDAA